MKPKQVKLINRCISINYDWVDDQENRTYGISRYKTLIIDIDSSLCEFEVKRTLVHELVHMLDMGNSEVPDLTELQTETISNELLYMIKNNKELIDYLVEKNET